MPTTTPSAVTPVPLDELLFLHNYPNVKWDNIEYIGEHGVVYLGTPVSDAPDLPFPQTMRYECNDVDEPERPKLYPPDRQTDYGVLVFWLGYGIAVWLIVKGLLWILN